MVDAGVLTEDEPVELIEGELVMVPPQGPLHGDRLTELTMFLVPRYAGHAVVRVQLPLDVDLLSMPEPDLAVTRSTPGRHPRGSDALVIIEVSKTSLAIDRGKAKLYARASAPIYWILDLEGRRLEERTEPTEGEYRVVRLYSPSDEITLPGLTEKVSVATLLGPGDP